MAKFFGTIGFVETVETRPGVMEEVPTEKSYYGDFVRNTRRLESSGGVNDNISLNNSISIIADPYAIRNFHAMRFVEYLAVKWEITNVEVQYPRLILTIGDKYNG